LTSNTDGLDFTYDNDDIKSMYRSVFNLRGGGEYRFNKFRARVGYSFMPDPYAAPQNDIDNSISSYTGGVGYRTSKFFVDLGLAMSQWKSSYVPYHLANNAPVVAQKNSMTAITLTFGLNL
jgi:long-subunit fatty acid transport protein